jgi:YD repeat-containing protein
MEDSSTIVLTVHGIRTYGSWTHRLAALLRMSGSKKAVIPYAYGYFSAIAFLIPFLRWIEVRRFRKHFLELAAQNPGAKFCIVAHSFGTFIVMRAIQGIPVQDCPAIQRVILCGSVLSPTLDLSAILTNRVETLVNDCCVDDAVLLVSQFFVIGTGMAGRVGFYGFQGKNLVNRFHRGGHSGYFDDAFMQKWWLPIIADPSTEPVRSDLEGAPSVLEGVKRTIISNMNPVKIAAYLILIGWPVVQGIKAVNIVDQAKDAYLVSGEEQAIQTMLRRAHLPPELAKGTPLQQLSIKSGNYSVSYTDASGVTRTYNSRSADKGLFGMGWGSTLETNVVIEAGSPVVRYSGSGKHIRFSKEGPGRWVADGYLLKENQAGYEMLGNGGHTWQFSRKGQLVEQFEPGQPLLKLRWDGERPAEIMGRAKFRYNKETGILERIEFSDGRAASYKFENRALVYSSDVAGNVYRYEYDKNYNLTAILYSNGTRRVIGYDAKGLANYALYPNGYEMNIKYGELDKDASGKWTTALISLRLTKNGKSVVASDYTLFETFPEGRLFKTVELIDGARVETDYNPATQAPVRIRALGSVITFEYDEQGRLTNQRGNDSIKITYDSQGKISGWEKRDHAWNIVSQTSFLFADDGSVREIKNNKETFVLRLNSDGLSVSVGNNSLFLSSDKKTLNGNAIALPQKALVMSMISSVLSAAGRPAGLFETYRPCLCNAFPDSVLSSKQKEILRDSIDQLSAVAKPEV